MKDEDVIRFGTTNSSFLLCGSADKRLKGSEEATYEAADFNLNWKDLLEVSTAVSLAISFFQYNESNLTNHLESQMKKLCTAKINIPV